ncbi:2-polyprenyl-3-methyl-6-methoxy-1,4-benzoquinone monooxygenase [Sessilibacter sp. MAH1]
MPFRRLNPIDHLITQADRAIRTLTPGNKPVFHASPASTTEDVEMNERDRKHAAALMRINHCGEVCAQGLYQGQATTAKLPNVREEMDKAALEELDHLAWCEERIKELGGRTSALNPVWYAMSFGLGAAAGLVSDKISLGFVAATEDQVCKHLNDHLKKLPLEDTKSRKIVEQMIEDEQEHADRAIDAGGSKFPMPVKLAMTAVSKVMTKTTYRV